MVSSFSSKPRLDRRIRQLQKESELVREDMRALNRALKNRDEMERLPKLKSGKYLERLIPPPSRHDPVRNAGRPDASAMPPKMIEPGMIEPPRPSVFTVVPREPKGHPAAAPPSGNELPPPRTQLKDERFASLFSSGGFLGSVNVRQERNVQKNKAIFMLLVVFLVFFIVYKLVF